MASVVYGKVRWVDEFKDIPDNAEFIVRRSDYYLIELQRRDFEGLYWVLAQAPLESMSEKNYAKTLTEFRKIMQSNRTMWIVMPPWKYYKVHPEMLLDFD